MSDPEAADAAAAGLSGLEQFTLLANGEIEPPPMAKLMNMTLVEVDEGKVAFEGMPGPEHLNPLGTVHGGFAATLLDSALGCAVHTTLPAGESYATLTLEVKYVRPIAPDAGTVRVEAEVAHRGRRLATSTARLFSLADGKLLAHGTSTCLIV